MPAPILALTREMLRNPESIQLDRKPAPAVGITQAVYPVPQELKSALLVALLQRGEMQEALVFTRTKHRANRLADYLARHGIKAERIHGNRSQPQRTEALAGFKSGKYRVLVATDIAARGIDVEALGHVVNFDVPDGSRGLHSPGGRTARAELTAMPLPWCRREEEGELRGIERAVGKRLPRITVPDFDYNGQAGRPVRGAAGGADRRDPGQEGGRPGPVEGQGGPPGGTGGPPAGALVRGQSGGRGRPRNGGSTRRG